MSASITCATRSRSQTVSILSSNLFQSTHLADCGAALPREEIVRLLLKKNCRMYSRLSFLLPPHPSPFVPRRHSLRGQRQQFLHRLIAWWCSRLSLRCVQHDFYYSSLYQNDIRNTMPARGSTNGAVTTFMGSGCSSHHGQSLPIKNVSGMKNTPTPTLSIFFRTGGMVLHKRPYVPL